MSVVSRTKPLQILLIALVLVVTVIRFSNLFHTGFYFDTVTTFYTWANAALDQGFYEFWRSYGGFFDYLPGSIYYLMGIAWIARLFSPTPETFVLVLKFFNWLIEIGLSAVLFWLSRKYAGLDVKSSLIVGMVVYILPSLWFLSSIWGQIGSLVMLLVLLSVIFLYQGEKEKSRGVLKSKVFWSGAILGLGFWIKLQVILVFPVLLIYHLSQRDIARIFRQVVGFLAASLVIAGVPLLANHERLIANLSTPFTRENIISKSAATFWTLIGFQQKQLASDPVIEVEKLLYLSVAVVGMLIFSVVFAYVLKLLWSKIRDKKFAIDSFLILATISSLTYFLFYTKVYERYLHPAVIFGLVVWAVLPESRQKLHWLILIVALSFSHFLNLAGAYVWWGYTSPVWVGNLFAYLKFDVGNLSSILSLVVLVLMLVWFRFAYIGKVDG